MSAADARLLRAMSRALEPYETDMADLEKKAVAAAGSLEELKGRAESSAAALKEHEVHDVNRFLQLHQGMADLHHEFEFVKNFMTILQDSMIDGFRKLGAEVEKKDPNEVTPPRRGTNGR